MTKQPILTISKNGTKMWSLNGKRHRINGPALKFPDGHEEWYINGLLHRTDGPAVTYSHGNKYWYLNGELHRTNGPAVEFTSGFKEWYLNGKRIPEDLLPWYIATIVIGNLTFPANSKS